MDQLIKVGMCVIALCVAHEAAALQQVQKRRHVLEYLQDNLVGGFSRVAQQQPGVNYNY